MEIKQHKLDELKGKNPFKLPEGYFEGLTEQIMSRIPDDTYTAPKVVSLRDRVRPWLYLAAVFAGLLIFFRIFIHPVSSHQAQQDDASSSLQALISVELLQVISDDDLEYLDFIELQSLSSDFAEEIDNMDE